jgi:hypothetical protein
VALFLEGRNESKHCRIYLYIIAVVLCGEVIWKLQYEIGHVSYCRRFSYHLHYIDLLHLVVMYCGYQLICDLEPVLVRPTVLG